MEDRAYGCIPIRTINGVAEVLLVMKGNGPNGSHWWGLPKGHAEGNETPLEAAKRELWEETGIADCEIDEARHFEQRYQFEKDGQTIQKTVTYFYTTVAATEPVDVDRKEIVDYRWRSVPESIDYATHEETKALLREALS